MSTLDRQRKTEDQRAWYEEDSAYVGRACTVLIAYHMSNEQCHHRGKCNCRISRTRIPVPKRLGSVGRFVAVFFGRMFDQWSTRVVRGRGRLADLSNKASGGVRWARCSANISVLIRLVADHFAQRDFHFTTGGVSTEVPTPSPQRSPWFVWTQVGQFSLCARQSRKIAVQTKSFSSGASLFLCTTV